MNTAAMKAAAAHFKGRMVTQDIKPGSDKYLSKQAEFFTGVMAGWIALLGDDPMNHPDYSKTMPPVWIFGIMRGNDLVKETEALTA